MERIFRIIDLIAKLREKVQQRCVLATRVSKVLQRQCTKRYSQPCGDCLGPCRRMRGTVPHEPRPEQSPYGCSALGNHLHAIHPLFSRKPLHVQIRFHVFSSAELSRNPGRQAEWSITGTGVGWSRSSTHRKFSLLHDIGREIEFPEVFQFSSVFSIKKDCLLILRWYPG